jgi:hypothetical protein
MFVLAYCPWQNLVERIMNRNQQGNKKNRRELDWVLGNFVHCFDVSPVRRAQALDCICGKFVKERIAFYASPESKKTRMHILDETKQATLQAFSTDGRCYIYPRLAYDVIVNTKVCDPEQGAARVLDFVRTAKTDKFEQMRWLSC